MILELSLMAVSAAFMAFLLIHKNMERERGLKTTIQDVRSKADPYLRDIHQKTDDALSGITLRNLVFFFNHVFVAIVRLFMNVSHSVHTTSKSIVDKASKKKEDLTRSGAASFYLKQIKESKENGKTLEVKSGTEEEKM